MKRKPGRWKLFAVSTAALFSFTACNKQASESERLARGRELVKQMSDKLASSNTLSLSTQEYREIVARDGQKRTVQRAHDVVLRRPDRLYSKQTGDRATDTWYDGKYVTLAIHPDQVYGQIRSPETVDETLDALSKRFAIILPVGDLLYSRPETLLLSDDTKGGYVDTQKVAGIDCHHMNFTTPGVDWELWLPTQGDPLPKRIRVVDKKQRGAPVSDITFINWNLAASAPDDTFKPKVPQEYEGIAIIQRAAAISKANPDQQPDAHTRSGPKSARK
jgi:hypothetical protein